MNPASPVPGTSADDPAPPGGEIVTDPPWEAWTPWQASGRLAGVAAPWAVAAGWATDLFLGAQTREHEDLEIAVPAGRFGEVRDALAGYEFDVVGWGQRWPLDSPALALSPQTWVREPETGVYRLDIFREPHDGDTWVCRRDAVLRRPYREVIAVTADGVPYLVPEIVLLFKAKHSRPKDQADLELVLPRLDQAQRAWLAGALARVHPGHPWLALVGG
jgi:Aminoglycoside-2''-adenylyltransferase